MPAELKIMAPPAWKYKLIAYRGHKSGDPAALPTHTPPTETRACTIRQTKLGLL